MANAKKLTLQALRDQASDALKTDPGIELDLDNGQSVFIGHPLFVDDSVSESIEKAEGSVELAKAVLGEEGFKTLTENGGRSADVALAFAIMTQDTKGVTPGGTPTP